MLNLNNEFDVKERLYTLMTENYDLRKERDMYQKNYISLLVKLYPHGTEITPDTLWMYDEPSVKKEEAV